MKNDGNSMKEVWQRLEEMVASCQRFLDQGQVPAWPLMEKEQWPLHIKDLFDKGPATLKTGQAICKYCDFKSLCGLEAAL